MEAIQIEIILKQSSKKEVEEFIEFLKSLTQKEKHDFFIFMQGAKFAKALPEEKPTPVVKTT